MTDLELRQRIIEYVGGNIDPELLLVGNIRGNPKGFLRNLVFARAIYVYILRVIYELPYDELHKRISNVKHHASFMYAVNKVEDMRDDKKLDNWLQNLESEILT